ncbi:transportin 1 isoform 2-like protein [Naegleria gruberi]|uniref:Transportin 1 isoform 2-like protein n=1 Tax=Naegleria gruberi TaxID=5762 RepID=D2VTX0_NAEGR|nr:transportin 1 isoform 2-like protein [Naegleria gruberi]EFC39731.1 transportin 1 isoform 2-like protein [Naegleria gruberi]|eukprot:XP_002672475.1 transportin 1 isoform 2-like protein [Naegleria gruberi strain NEG-M]
MSWVPNEQGLQQVMELLINSRKGSTQIQKECTLKLQQFNDNVHDFNNYLVHIFSKCKEVDPADRQAAGLILKANLKQKLVSLTDIEKEHLRLLLLEALGDDIPFIRSTAGTLIAFIFFWDQIEAWPQCISQLLTLLGNSNNQQLVDGTMACLSKVCEDNYAQFEGDYAQQLTVLIPVLIKFMEYPNEGIRKNALSSILQFFQLDPVPTAITDNMDAYLRSLFNIANDNSVTLRKYACRAFVLLLDIPHYLKQAISTVIEYMIHCTASDDETLSLEACEFWTVLLSLDPKNPCQPFYPILQNHLPQLVPVLLSKMQYSEFEQASLLHDSERPDRDSDINPSVYHIKPKDSLEEEYDDEDDEDYEDFDEDDFGGDSDWSLRKCSATSLDLLSNVFGSSILPYLLPQIEQKMNGEVPWPVRESAILALGAVSDGCMTGMLQHLPKLIPYLLAVINDEKPLVRNITCWSLSRYARWIVEQPLDKYFEPVLAAILSKMLDNNKCVQEAASSAFATLEENAKTLVIPYLKPILETIASAFQIYQKKNIFILYDAIRTLADSVGSHLNKPIFIQLIIPPLITKWNNLMDDDKDLLPLLECLTGVAAALQNGFHSFAEPVFHRCIKIIQTIFEIDQKRPQEADREFVICSLDLIGGILEGLGPNVNQILTTSKLLDVLFICIKDRFSDVRQSGLGVIGDLAKNGIEYLKNGLPQFLPIIIANINPKAQSVCNNACWSFGEITVKIGPEIASYATEIFPKMIPILNSPSTNNSLVENLSVTIGRIALVCPQIVAPNLPVICKNLCLGLSKVTNKIEREHGYAGLCAAIKANPSGAVQHFSFVLDTISNCTDPSQELKNEFVQILQGFKQGMGDQAWISYLTSIPEDITLKLRQDYNI